MDREFYYSQIMKEFGCKRSVAKRVVDFWLAIGESMDDYHKPGFYRKVATTSCRNITKKK